MKDQIYKDQLVTDSEATNPKSTHCVSLDGLRWFAFLGVFLYHANESLFYFGRYGVHVFFVLSGFLIGNILLAQKSRSHVSIQKKLLVFYARRSIRIFPLYYAVLFAIVALDYLKVLDGHLFALPYHVTYTSNFYMYWTEANLASHTHFWTLCVEEHFYLVAPFFLLYCSTRKLWQLIGVVVVACAIARSTNGFTLSNPRFEFQSFIQFDMFGIGIAFAMLIQSVQLSKLQAYLLTPALIGVLVVCISKALRLSNSLAIEMSIFPVCLALSTGAMIFSLWHGRLAVISRFLSYAPFAYLGKISYGLYILHNFSYVMARDRVGWDRVFALSVCLLATIVAASLSWHLFESPINGLKRNFRY